MKIDFYTNMSDKRYVDKDISLVKSVENAVLLDSSTNISAPSFRVNGVDFENINYCYVSKFRRYYYVTSVNVLFGNQTEITCRTDVLMSFATDIKLLNGIIIRNNNAGNILVSDDKRMYRTDDIITNLAFSGSEFLSEISAGNYSFVLNTFGGVNSGNN